MLSNQHTWLSYSLRSASSCALILMHNAAGIRLPREDAREQSQQAPSSLFRDAVAGLISQPKVQKHYARTDHYDVLALHLYVTVTTE